MGLLQSHWLAEFTGQRVWKATLLGAILSLTGHAPAHAIIGGYPDSGHPLAAIMIIDDQGQFCSAVAITKRDILTAAHCIVSDRPHRIAFRDAQNSPVLIEPARIILHPEYDANAIKKRTRSIDLAIINLRTDLPNDVEIASITNKSAGAGDVITVKGYGRRIENNKNEVGQLLKVDLQVVEPYGKSKIILWLSSQNLGATIGACHGDSGGPQFLDRQLIAITTWTTGLSNRECGELTQGALIRPQLDWIKKNLSDGKVIKSD